MKKLIPALGPGGHLPQGRYLCTLEELEAEFVRGEPYRTSVTRQTIFGGFVRYLSEWEDATLRSGSQVPILRSVWVAGSFVSAKLDPSDIDVSPIIDGPAADAMKGRPGSGAIRKLVTHRESVRNEYNVEPFPIRWCPIVRPFRARANGGIDELAYLSDRGKMDDWWQRRRIDNEDIPSIASCDAKRGYLEVTI